MKAVRLVEQTRPLELQEIELPRIGANEILVRVEAAGICHSDAHYRAGTVKLAALPLTLGHEVAGSVERVGEEVDVLAPGDRVCLHYMVTCGECRYCRAGREQFCKAGEMLGNQRDGGYAEYVQIPARSAFPLPDEIPFEWGAVLMCSSATSLHALRKARLAAGERVAIFGAGGLGMSAVQLARALGAGQILAVDIDAARLEMARSFGAIPVDAARGDPVAEILERTEGEGVDVALELVGLPLTMQQSVQCLAIQGRAALAGLTDGTIEVTPYSELLAKEAEIIGVSDHLATEIRELTDLVCAGKLDLSHVITRRVPLEAEAINSVLDGLDGFAAGVRAVISR